MFKSMRIINFCKYLKNKLVRPSAHSSPAALIYFPDRETTIGFQKPVS